MKKITALTISLFAVSNLIASELVPGTNEKTPTSENIAKLYISTFDRAPDTGGLNYWKSDSKSLDQMAKAWFDLSEVKAKYDGTTTTDFIKTVYRNMLNRELDISLDSDKKALDYWVDLIDNNHIKRYQLIVSMMNIINNQKTTDPDRMVLENKTKVGMSYYYSNFNVDNYHLNIAHESVTDVDRDSGTVTASENDLISYRNYERSSELKNFLSSYSNPAVILVMGQSNIANHGTTKYDYKGITNKVFTFFNKNIRPARDQAIDYGTDKHLASGNAGNFLLELGDKIVLGTSYDAVIFVNLAIGGSSSKQWIPDSTYVERKNSIDNYEFRTGYFERVKEAKVYQDYIGKKYTHVLWQQGESDTKSNIVNSTNTTYSTYYNNFLKVYNGLNSLGITAPIYMSRTSYINGYYNSEVVRAQNALIKNYSRIKPGTDTDYLVKDSNGVPYREYRSATDNVHFNSYGLSTLAAHWDWYLKNY